MNEEDLRRINEAREDFDAACNDMQSAIVQLARKIHQEAAEEEQRWHRQDLCVMWGRVVVATGLIIGFFLLLSKTP